MHTNPLDEPYRTLKMVASRLCADGVARASGSTYNATTANAEADVEAGIAKETKASIAENAEEEPKAKVAHHAVRHPAQHREEAPVVKPVEKLQVDTARGPVVKPEDTKG